MSMIELVKLTSQSNNPGEPTQRNGVFKLTIWFWMLFDVVIITF